MDLKKIINLCIHFLWDGDPWIKKIAKAKQSYHPTPIKYRGLEINIVKEFER